MLSVRRNDMEILKNKLGFICDMDGVIYHGNKLLPGVPEFVDWLYKENKTFFFLQIHRNALRKNFSRS